MKNFFLFLILFLFGQKTFAGFQIQAGALLFGYKEIEMSGSNTIKSETVTSRPDNQISYTASIGYQFKWLEPLSIKTSVGYLAYRTQESKVDLSTDNGTYETNMFDARLTAQISLNNYFSLRFGISYPFSTELKGPMNSTSGDDTYQLRGEIGYHASFGYHFAENTHVRLGYIRNSAGKAEAESNLDVHATYNHLVLELGTGF